MNLYIHTIGCQMNVYDSEQIALRLQAMGYQQTDRQGNADLILLNTCAIRDKAEQKVFSYLGRLAELKAQKPSLIIGVGGCVAQQEGRKILSRVPFVDLVFGTRSLDRLPALIHTVQAGKGPVVDVDMTDTLGGLAAAIPESAQAGICRFVTVMRGCDNYCNYCVVPYVRGAETSRAPQTIIDEIQGLANAGVREVTLLGQNVNSYGKKEGFCDFAELLERVSHIDGICRIRFTTSHPKDLSDRLITTFADLEKLCHHIHLPVQAGSDTVLRRMNRKYTRDAYLERIRRIRAACPGIAVTSDFIVGFPGETDDDFQQTLDLIRTVGYDGLFAFKYSDRPLAPAAKFPEKVSEAVKKDRLGQLLALQEKNTFRRNGDLVGTVQTVLVERRGRRLPALEGEGDPWTGRTSGNKVVNFIWDVRGGAGTEPAPGRLVDVTIQRALAHSLWGMPVTGTESTAPGEVDAACGSFAQKMAG
ncbi:MAG: tRNA (N6-isopentenyl adenosine(37)-C2)-methylthiotransferase MiaB [Desulfobacterales bacterium]|nr:tRNA (N6-isopentenyl adenosine(37)-C2)-methylthiotransferase MiaB [Desulfobacterales bacterium]